MRRRLRLAGCLALFGLVWAGFALRVYQLPAQSLWYDEGVSWYLTRMSLPQLTVWTANDIQPPLYYYLLWIWVQLVGTSEYALRFLSVIFGTGTLSLLWVLARRLFGRPTAWLVLLLGCISPLQVYYAQEARMYTLLAGLGLLSSTLLLCLLDAWLPRARTSLLGPDSQSGAAPCPPNEAAPSRTLPNCPFKGRGRERDLPVLAAVYTLATTAALYTHYFAFFLAAAHVVYALYWVLRWKHNKGLTPPRHPARSVERVGGDTISVLLIPLAVLLLYAPWLPYLFSRYGLDSSYWPGALNLGEVARKLVIAFGLGETVNEHIGIWLALGYGMILIISIGALAWRARAGSRQPPAVSDRPFAICHLPFGIRLDALVFLLIYLFVPVGLVLLSAYQTPKFNPRYAMLAWPAFILLLGGGLSALLGAARIAHSRRMAWLGSAAFVAALGFVLVTSAVSLVNWYTPYRDNQFNKADFRITAGIVRQRTGPDETVLLSSGHMFPAWAYYFGWRGWQALPQIEVLDVNAVLDMSVGRQLDDMLLGKRGLWLVRWQNEATDPFDVLPLLLGTIGEQDDTGQFWHMELRHYRLPAEARFDLSSFITRPVGATFGGEVRLLGVRPLSPLSLAPSSALKSGALSDDRDATDLVLVWEIVAPVSANYAVSVHLVDVGGNTLANGDHLPARPTREWPLRRPLPDRISLDLPSDLPPGECRLEIGLYDPGRSDLPRLGPVILDATGELQPGERVLIPVMAGGGLE